jgi:BirA family biotin operon repressor/biotin-[acetyl-CoA-carboxylase] ligase
LQELERWYSIFINEGSAAILKAWRNRARIKGRRVKITSFGETLTGTAVNVDSEGALILETADGERKRVVAGDVEYSKNIEAPNLKHRVPNKSQCPKF